MMLATGRDYSQFGEQTAILQWAATQPNPGSFIDLGAYDGADYSNTACLAERGWPGVCVDASPDAVAACATRYAGRPDVTVIAAAFPADDTEGPVTIHWSPGAMYSAIRPSIRTDTLLVPIQVPRLDLGWFAQFVQDLPAPRFCSVDLEGASLDALEWLLSHAEPDCVCVEANIPADRKTLRTWMTGWTEMPLTGNHTNMIFRR